VNAPLSRVIADLQRWYDVKIELGNSKYATYQLTATLQEGSVDEVLDVVVKSLDLRAVRRGQTVRIVGKNAQPSQRP
jgi:ferric-dicitrate binding protein FerR (iron transport regulator)